MSLIEEAEYTISKIEEDFSNYSSWHERSYILPTLYNEEELINVLESDFELVKNAFYTLPDDQSAWFYHKWLLLMTRKINLPNYLNRVQTELEMLHDLINLEPSAKWPKITSLFLMKELGIKNDDPLYQNYYQFLETNDPMHVQFYIEFFK